MSCLLPPASFPCLVSLPPALCPLSAAGLLEALDVGLPHFAPWAPLSMGVALLDMYLMLRALEKQARMWGGERMVVFIPLC